MILCLIANVLVKWAYPASFHACHILHQCKLTVNSAWLLTCTKGTIKIFIIKYTHQSIKAISCTCYIILNKVTQKWKFIAKYILLVGIETCAIHAILWYIKMVSTREYTLLTSYTTYLVKSNKLHYLLMLEQCFWLRNIYNDCVVLHKCHFRKRVTCAKIMYVVIFMHNISTNSPITMENVLVTMRYTRIHISL